MNSQNEYNNVSLYRVSDEPAERARMIKDLETGHHAGKMSDGRICVITVVQGESMIVKVQTGSRVEVTQYDSRGRVVSFQE